MTTLQLPYSYPTPTLRLPYDYPTTTLQPPNVTIFLATRFALKKRCYIQDGRVGSLDLFGMRLAIKKYADALPQGVEDGSGRQGAEGLKLTSRSCSLSS